MVCPDRWLGAVPKRPSSCVWTLGVTSTNVPPSPATFWPFAAANRQNAIATRARPRPGRGGATPREGPEPPRADEAERTDIYRLCRRDIHFRHLTGQRRASSVCPFFLPCRCQVCRLLTASFGNAKRKNGEGRKRRSCAQTGTTEGVLFVCHSLVSYEHRSHENSFCTFSFFETSTLRGDISFPLASLSHRRHLPGASSRTPHPLAVPRLKLVVPRGRTHPSRTSMFGASALSAAPKVHGLPLSKATRKSRVPAARSTGTCALLRFRRANATRDRVARRAFFRDVVCQAVERPHATQARLLSVASAKKYPPMCRKKRSRDHAVSRLRLPASPPDAGLRVRAMAAEDKSRIGLCGLAVMGQVRLSPPHEPRSDRPNAVTAHRDYLTKHARRRANEAFPAVGHFFFPINPNPRILASPPPPLTHAPPP